MDDDNFSFILSYKNSEEVAFEWLKCVYPNIKKYIEPYRLQDFNTRVCKIPWPHLAEYHSLVDELLGGTIPAHSAKEQVVRRLGKTALQIDWLMNKIKPPDLDKRLSIMGNLYGAPYAVIRRFLRIDGYVRPLYRLTICEGQLHAEYRGW